MTNNGASIARPTQRTKQNLKNTYAEYPPTKALTVSGRTSKRRERWRVHLGKILVRNKKDEKTSTHEANRCC